MKFAYSTFVYDDSPNDNGSNYCKRKKIQTP